MPDIDLTNIIPNSNNPRLHFDETSMDGWYSAIWGSYEKSNERCLGVRWNGDSADDPNGYPKQGVFPLWYVEPHILHRPILLALQQELVNNPSLKRTPEYQRNIIIALGECERA